jgi:hypothetical protein
LSYTCWAPAVLDLSLYFREAILVTIHQHYREALASKAPGDRCPEAQTDTEDRRNLAVQESVLSLTAQAPPEGNSNSSSDSGYISIE